MPTAHELTTHQGALSVRDFEGRELLMYSPVEARYFHELLISIFRSAHVTPVYSQYLSQVQGILALVCRGANDNPALHALLKCLPERMP
ncbi:hypothetical protein P2Q00_41800 [Streptomyces coacervatus]|uniref:hypothetical protein n=1 Tax=Streptomyces coacervatus TaxID=647381 RepID=UPI0023DA1F01|nr:hypothetical protein [Streptomyces coacervatus]MDF2271911.1 hypothetical protein [Streptomyces coacervatus]